MLTDRELSATQRTWVPTDAVEAYDQWPAAAKVEMAYGELVFISHGDTWDWRSVALAARALPGWRISLYNGGLLKALQPGGHTA